MRMELDNLVKDLTFASEMDVRGLDARAYRRAAARGSLIRPFRGVYVDAEAWTMRDPRRQYQMQVISALAESRSWPIGSHHSALALCGLPLVGRPKHVHVLATMAAGTRTEGVFRRHASRVLDVEIQNLGQIQRTSVKRTLVEYGAIVSFGEAVVALDAGLREDAALRPDDLLAVADSIQLTKGRRALDRALEFADPLAESPGESLSRALIHQLGFPAPILQHEFYDEDGFVARVDFGWPDHDLAGEFDGAVKYLDPSLRNGRTADEVVLDEKRREDRIRALGVRVVRWDWSHATDPRRMFGRLTAAGLPSSRRRFRAATA